MLTPPPAAVTATTNDELASSFCNAATPSKGVVLASAGARDTHGDGSIDSEQRRSENEESPQSLFSERVERERKWKKTRLFFIQKAEAALTKRTLSLSPPPAGFFFISLFLSLFPSQGRNARNRKKRSEQPEHTTNSNCETRLKLNSSFIASTRPRAPRASLRGGTSAPGPPRP